MDFNFKVAIPLEINSSSNVFSFSRMSKFIKIFQCLRFNDKPFGSLSALRQAQSIALLKEQLRVRCLNVG